MGQGDGGTADVGVAGALAQFGAQIRVGVAASRAEQLQRELGLEGQRGAVGDLEGVVDRDRGFLGVGEGGAGAGQGRGGDGRFAAGRVDREVGTGDVDADVAQVQRDAADDVGDRVGGLGVDRDLGGEGVDLDRRADDDHAEVEGADQGRVDGGDRDRRAVVGAGQVELAGRIGEHSAQAVAGDRVADFRGRRAARVFELADAGVGRGWAMSASGQ